MILASLKMMPQKLHREKAKTEWEDRKPDAGTTKTKEGQPMHCLQAMSTGSPGGIGITNTLQPF